MKNTTIAILLLFTSIIYGQEAVQHYFYGSNETLGAEMYFKLRNSDSSFLGVGFSGTLKNSKTKGEFAGKHIQEYERVLATGIAKEQWFSLYAIGSLGYVGKVLLSGSLGVGMYGQMMNFTDGQKVYNKNDKLIFDPIIGLNAQYQITKDIGVMTGFDTFNGAKIGFSIIFE